MKHGRVSVRVCLFYKDCVGRMFKIMRFNNVVFEAAYGTAAQLPVSDLPEIVFSGRSNVGKSSLINKLFNRKALAKVSSTPGKTATVNF